ncbi:C2H2-type zinc finger protein [Aspergillus lucknowensis]|uniref:C2H2-type domain-containing protein n=1 Tax=Aspergillus lucknowensis TaxID=176173 RepID=A0ABR4LQ40_9EURO
MPRTTARAEIPLPITYTPTTHRISKAKKGKRVHACEFPGCNKVYLISVQYAHLELSLTSPKVFTRAEHRRRHELNHNPEALYRCTQTGCKKSFHRSDLLVRHMERHELEAQMDSSARWGGDGSARTSPEQYSPRYTMVNPNPAQFLAVMQAPTPIKAPAIQPGLTIDGLLWNAMEMPSEHPTHALPPPQAQEPVEDSRFYSTPEACSSPSSEGTSYSVPSYPGSSISSTSPGLVDSYPDPVIDSKLTSSPAPLHATLDWDQPASSVAPTSMIPMPIADNFIHPALQSWPVAQHMSYNGNYLPPVPYETTVGAKSWSL